MNIYLNNNINASGMITFNNTPTIVHVQSGGSGTKARLELTVTWGADGVTEYYININDVKIVATTNFENAVGNVWWTPIDLYQSGDNYAETSAYTICRALNNTELANNYNIYIDTQSNDVHNKVIVEAKEFSKKYNFKNVTTNAPWVRYTTVNGASSDLMDGSIVICDVYAETNNNLLDEIGGNGKSLPHIATFQKRYYKNGISFNISSVLNNLCEPGEIVEYNVVMSFILNNEMRSNQILKHNYAVNGYQCNLGLDYIKNVNNVFLAQNVSRGDERSTLNNTTLFYIDKITFSIYKEYYGTFNYTVKYLDSALNTVKTVNMSYNCNQPLNHISFTPEEGYYYVDIILPQGTLRYNNIRPEKYANPSDVQTLYWFNSYGGVSFMPFTSKKEETRESEKILYKRNNFNYYNEGMRSYQKVYDMENTYEVTLTSHYMDKNGTYLMNDLNNAFVAWTYVEGKKYEVIIKSVEVDEQSNNGVYVAKVKFEYSLPDRW